MADKYLDKLRKEFYGKLKSNASEEELKEAQTRILRLTPKDEEQFDQQKRWALEAAIRKSMNPPAKRSRANKPPKNEKIGTIGILNR